jgi:hypothetical protein
VDRRVLKVTCPVRCMVRAMALERPLRSIIVHGHFMSAVPTATPSSLPNNGTCIKQPELRRMPVLHGRESWEGVLVWMLLFSLV